MNETELLKQRVERLEQTVNFFTRPDRYVFDRPVTGSGVSGVYTPTLTNVGNAGGGLVAYECHYIRLGNVVVVSGKLDIDVDSVADTQVGISLPFTSDFAVATDCSGMFCQPGSSGEEGIVIADTTNNRAEINYYAVATSNQTGRFLFTYKLN